ncbi:CdaR family transcriptional regulator (plasmid) [Pseudonocardia sp. EC080610-09]|uniref:helix-turn-helix domain-containing protein n=1 Tax=unclassified Pseudonocardia TaxID=2619320 RepID=UPI0007062745|nr:MULTISPECIES: helix-turn-helix domain-containing protein [unclassified Pseudonocardia]ALL79794.1 CdaR family transcriptional regulator [Pseudonocardia sp. EC080610-09]ALL85713.1 CdaR family transcriptional regulator [Pseudonocardia sp. EC080619-01]
MADDGLQEIVDELAQRLQRSVAIDDPAIRLLAASRHFGDEDAVRVTSVLNRSVSPDLTEEVLGHGIATWTRPGQVVIPAEDTLPRLCAPVRCNGLLLGYLWLIDTAGTLAPDEITLTEDAAARAGVVLYRRLILHERSRARHEAILRELVSSDRAARVQAAEDLRAENLFPDRHTSFLVLGVQVEGGDDASAVALESAVEEGVRAGDDVALTVANRSRAWILYAARRGDVPVSALSNRVLARFRSLAGDGARVVLGVGSTVEDLGSVVESHRHAFLAARAALLVPSVGTVARWGELGPYEVLLRLPVDDLLLASQVPALAALERHDPHGVLMETLEAYVDHAGDVRRTAELLCVHRATLYHRLKRIETHTGYRLGRGDDWLTLHLGVKLRALAAAYRRQS